MSILSAGDMEVKENVLGALGRFVDPASVEMQWMVVNLGAYPLLVSALNSGSPTAKARAATLIGKLSANSFKLSDAPVRTGCWCFRVSAPPTCVVHGSVCDVESTFCLLKACATAELVKLLQEREEATTCGSLQALGMLIQDGSPARGAIALLDAGAIAPVLDVLSWGMLELKEEVLEMLEKLFQVTEVADWYGTQARIPLIALSTMSNENGELGRKAAQVLAVLERFSKSCALDESSRDLRPQHTLRSLPPLICRRY